MTNKALLSLALLMLVGCGESGPPTGTVSGKLTIGGAAPKEPVRVQFINSMIGQGANATTAADGSYKLDQPLHVAEYTVYFEKLVDATEPISANDELLLTVPKTYRSEASSPLKKKVEKGANSIDLEVPGA